MDFLQQNLIPEIAATVLLAAFLYFLRKGVIIIAPLAKRKEAIVGAALSQGDFQAEILHGFKRATKVDILVIRGLAILALKDSMFRQLLDGKKQNTQFAMRVLVMNPASPYAKARAGEIREGENTMTGGIRYSIDEILALKNSLSLNIVVKAYDSAAVWRYIFLDDDLYVSSYLAGEDGYNTPMHHLKNTRASHFLAHRRQFASVWSQARPVEELNVFTTDAAEALMRGFGCDDALVFHGKTVARVAMGIAINASDSENVDLNMVELGALLHDVGKARSSRIDHAIIGSDFIRSSKNAIPDGQLREKLARIVETHVGGGIAKEEVEQINREMGVSLPIRDFIPYTIEEKIVALADKMVEGSHERAFAQQLREKELKFGKDSAVVKRIEQWYRELRPYLK